jgi:hypothetical protein
VMSNSKIGNELGIEIKEWKEEMFDAYGRK